MDRLQKKYQTARQYVPAPVLHTTSGATVGIIGYGSTESAILEAMHQLETDHGIKADFLRLRALPFNDQVAQFVNKYDQVFVVEMNRDGQMNQILTIEYPQRAPYFKSVAYGDGMPASAKWVREGILAKYTASVRVNGNGKAVVKAKAAAVKTKVVKGSLKKNSVKMVKKITSKTGKPLAKKTSKK
jgi:pyruvate/2-oxoacid:ferredoxin oxidoreductase alpha subunit